MKKFILFSLVLLSVNLIAGNKSDIYKACITGDKILWKTVVDRMIAARSTDPEIRAELLNYQYGYIGWVIGDKDYTEARKYLALAEDNLDFLSNNTRYTAQVSAYRAAFLGYRIAMNNMLAPVLGFRSIDYAKEAVTLDPGDPFNWIQNGNVEFYWPKVFGGSKKEALSHFRRALELYDRNPSASVENWNYINLLLLIAQSYTYLDDYNSSKNTLDKILKIAPDFVWVKDKMYPGIEVKAKE